MNASYYVYVLFRETGLPFYVGIGKGQRWTVHEREARTNTLQRGANTHKLAIIRRTHSAGIEVPKIKIAQRI